MARVRRVLLYFVALLVVIYVADFIAARTNPLVSLQVEPYYAIHLKNKKVEFDFDVPKETQSCVQSMAPHFGYPPCWYLKRHTVERIDE
jgi:hypothetical protein